MGGRVNIRLANEGFDVSASALPSRPRVTRTLRPQRHPSVARRQSVCIASNLHFAVGQLCRSATHVGIDFVITSGQFGRRVFEKLQPHVGRPEIATGGIAAAGHQGQIPYRPYRLTGEAAAAGTAQAHGRSRPVQRRRQVRKQAMKPLVSDDRLARCRRILPVRDCPRARRAP